MRWIWVGILVISFCIVGSAQEQDKKASADSILLRAKQASNKSRDQIDGIFIESFSRYVSRKEKVAKGNVPSFEFGKKLWVRRLDRVKIKTLITYPDGQLELQELTILDKVAAKSSKIKLRGEPGFSAISITEKGDPKRNEEILLQKTTYEAFGIGFPVFFYSGAELDFVYLGVAKAGEQRADVLGTALAGDYKIKLFFEQGTSQLLMMIADFVDAKTEESIEHKYFFSDYREESGINFAHKIVVHENGEIVEERSIKKIELNPKLEADFFDVKK